MFIFPMAGLSSRFQSSGYTDPKFKLLTHGGRNLFQDSIYGFKRYFDVEDFLFIYRQGTTTADEIYVWCNEVGLKNKNIRTFELTNPTLGQAETVFKACSQLQTSSTEPIFIFNIDTIYKDFKKPSDIEILNFIDVTNVPGDHWSFVRPDSNDKNIAIEVKEKQRISNLCSVGLYGFKSIEY